MLKKLMVTTAITGLMIGAAVAEGMPPSPAPSSPPAATESTPPAKSPSMSTPATGPAATSPAPSSSASATAPSASAKFVNSQRSDQYLASKFKGTDVIGTDDQKIGDVSDILFDKDGKIEAYVVSVGGFLGLNAKYVAVAPDTLRLARKDGGALDAVIETDKDQLRAAPEYVYLGQQPAKTDASKTDAQKSDVPAATGTTTTQPAQQ